MSNNFYLKRKAVAFIILLSFFALSASSIVSAQSFDKTRLDSLLTYLYSKQKFMGTFTLSQNGERVYNKAFGYADLENKILSTTETRYRIGSITKTFTAVIFFQLTEEGKISLETKLSEYFPEVPNAEKITMELLLTHKSGIHNFTNTIDTSFYLYPKTKQEMIEMIKSYKSDFEPDSKSEYSNANFVLLAYILEKITGKEYADLIQERICKKAGLENTYYGKSANIKDNECYSYMLNDGKWVVEKQTDMSVPHGAGAIVSTPNDLTKYIEALFGGKLISGKSLEEMTTIKDKFGRGCFAMNFFDKKGIGHTGGIDGFVSVLTYFPEDKLAVSLCSNAMNYGNELLVGVLSVYFGKSYEFPSFVSINVKPEILVKYEGVFSSESFPLKITIKVVDGKLTAQATGQASFPLDAVSEKVFKYDAAKITITFSDDGDELRIKQGEEVIMKREK